VKAAAEAPRQKMTPQASVSTPFVNIPADEKTMAEMITRITPLVRVVLFANVLRL
jgi:hypothetical protein